MILIDISVIKQEGHFQIIATLEDQRSCALDLILNPHLIAPNIIETFSSSEQVEMGQRFVVGHFKLVAMDQCYLGRILRAWWYRSVVVDPYWLRRVDCFVSVAVGWLLLVALVVVHWLLLVALYWLL